jgi:hypothetical protein
MLPDKMRRITAVAFVLALSCSWAASALAQTDDEKITARSLGQEGQAALDKGDMKTAEDRFHRAVLIFDNAKAPVPPTLLLGYARGAAGSHHYIAAEEAYNRMIRAGLPPGAPAPFVKALEDAKKEIESVSPHIARVTINVTGCDNPSVTLDGAPVPSMILGIKKPVDPGTHEVKASAPGCKAQAASFTVEDGKEATSSLTLEKEPTTNVTPPTGTGATTTTTPNTTPTTSPTTTTTVPPETASGGGNGLKIAGFVALGIGGAGVIMGAVTGGIALGKHGDLQKVCGPTGDACPASAQSTINDYKTMGALSTVGFIVGGVGIAAGLAMVLLAPSPKKQTAAWIQPYVGFGSVGAYGQF